MRILLVNKFHYPKGGAETYYLTLGSELKRMGHDVAFFSMHHPDNLPSAWSDYFVTQREYNYVRSPIKAARDGLALTYSQEAKNKFESLCEDFRPDVVHLNNVHRQITLSILDAPYLARHNVPVVYTAHDYILVCPSYVMLDGAGRVCDACLGGRFSNCLRRKCVKGSVAKSLLAVVEAEFLKATGAYRKIDRIIAPSEFMRKKLLEGGFPPDKVTHMQNFAGDEVLKGALSGGDNTDRDNPYLLFFGRLSREKGIDVLVDAFTRAIPNLPENLRLVIAGDGPERAAIEEKLAGMAHEDAARIELVGFQVGEDMRRYAERASLAIASSRCRENMPYSIVEAFALGTPVVGTRIGGIPEMVREGETGFVCEPDDAESMASAMERGMRAFLDRGAYEKLRSNCRAYVLERCPREKYMNRLVELYQEVENAKC